MIAVVDRSVLIDHLRGVIQAREVLDRVLAQGGRLASSVLTRTEVLAGVRPGERGAVEALFGAIDWLPVDDTIADLAGDLAYRFLKSHPGVDTVDYVIAATARAVDGQLLTRNIKHFPMFPELRAPY